MEKAYTTADVFRLCGVKRNRLQSWMERGWIAPSIQKAEGSGTKNLFSLKDLNLIRLFKQLVAAGFSRPFAAETIAAMACENPKNAQSDWDTVKYDHFDIRVSIRPTRLK